MTFENGRDNFFFCFSRGLIKRTGLIVPKSNKEGGQNRRKPGVPRTNLT
jgi:hypothetical protein